jgi:hypothetical protein
MKAKRDTPVATPSAGRSLERRDFVAEPRLSRVKESCSACDDHSLQARVNAQTRYEVRDVVSHGRRAQRQASRDLIRRSSVSEQMQHLELPSGEL